MFKAVDKDGSNTIDQKEFLEMMALKVKEKDSEDEVNMFVFVPKWRNQSPLPNKPDHIKISPIFGGED